MHNQQIKTLELLIVDELHNPKSYNRIAHSAFTQMFQHFSNEEYLYGIEHTLIITKIYMNGFYKFKSTKALSIELHIDTKTLLAYRKSYLRLFAKFYLNLSSPANSDFLLLYEHLKSNKTDSDNFLQST